MRKRTLAAGASILALTATLLSVPAHAGDRAREPEVVAGGLIGPLTLAVGNRGDVYVTQTFANTLSKIDRAGTVTDLHTLEGGPEAAELVGVTYDRGSTYHIESDLSSGTPTTHIVRTRNGERTVVSDDLWAHEVANNPDAGQTYGFRGLRGQCAADVAAFEEQAGVLLDSYTGIVESHGYQLDAHNGTIYVADAAANAVLKVDERTGDISTVGVLPGNSVRFTAEIEAALEAQMPGADIPDCVVGKQWVAEPVPTDVQRGWDGGLYVTTLGGIVGEIVPLSSVYRVSARGGPTFEVTGNLHGATGLAIAPTGAILVAEMFGGEVSVIPPFHNRATTLFAADSPADVAIDGRTVYATTGTFGEGALVRYSYRGW